MSCTNYNVHDITLYIVPGTTLDIWDVINNNYISPVITSSTDVRSEAWSRMIIMKKSKIIRSKDVC